MTSPALYNEVIPAHLYASKRLIILPQIACNEFLHKRASDTISMKANRKYEDSHELVKQVPVNHRY